MNSLLQGINLYLVGMMGAGKTIVGKLLATQLDYRFVDTDAVIEKVTEQSITQLFARFERRSFGSWKVRCWHKLCTNLAIATGGGVLRRENWSLHHGLVVWLDVPVELMPA